MVLHILKYADENGCVHIGEEFLSIMIGALKERVNEISYNVSGGMWHTYVFIFLILRKFAVSFIEDTWKV